MAAILISHSSRDDADAEALAGMLRGAGFSSLFLDLDPADGIEAGARWEQTLYARLRQVHAVVVVVFTSAWFDSRWCFAEVVQAREKGKAIFPVLVQPCELPGILADLQAVSLLEDREAGFGRLIAWCSPTRPTSAAIGGGNRARPPRPGR